MKKLHRGLILAFLFSTFTGLLFIACKNDPPAAPAATVDVSGVTRDEQGYSVPNATIEALSSSGATLTTSTTDDLGNFTLAGIPTNLNGVQIRITREDFKTFSMQLPTVIQKGTSNEPIFMSMIHADSACGRLSMLIRDVNTLLPINDAEVRLRRNGTLVTQVRTDATGHIDFNYLMAGTYSVRVSKAGYAVVERNVTIQFCDSTSLDIRMSPATAGEDSCCHGILTIIPRDSVTNAILAAVSVKVTKVRGDTRTASTGTGQAVVFTEMCPGEYEIRLGRDGYQVQEFSITMGCNQVLELTRLMKHKVVDSCCNGVITVVVRDSATNAVVPNATVALWHAGALLGSQTTNSSGLATFIQKCMGEYGISVKREGYTEREMVVQLGCDEQKQVEMHLKTKTVTVDTCYTAKLSVRVKDSTYAEAGWLNDVLVTIYKDNAVVYSGYTNNDGLFQQSGLQAPATYTIVFSKQGFQTKSWTISWRECNTITETIRLHP